MVLTETERQLLQEVYTRAYKKYFAFSSTAAGGVVPFNYAEALEVAKAELARLDDIKRAEIEAKYAARVLTVNTDADKRGLGTSTAALQLTAKADEERTLALSKLDTASDARVKALARKMLADNAAVMRLSLTADKNSLDMFVTQSKAGGYTDAEKQKAMDEEVYAEYLRFLLGKPPNDAFSIVQSDPLFFYNLSAEYFTRLSKALQDRAWTV